MIIYKTPNLKDEFESISIDNRLKVIIYALVGFCSYKFNKDITITEIYRTQEMQDLYYKDNPDYQESKWQSVHQFWRGADISILNFTTSEQNEIYKFINNSFLYATPNKSTALIHNIGQGIHLHIQTDNNSYTKITK